MQKLAIIDTIGPFMEDAPGETINWSKNNFAALETSGRLTSATRKKLISRFDTYLHRIHSIGYNAISIDDLAHIAQHPFYSPALTTLLDDYTKLYTEIFSLAKRYNLAIYITSDYLFSHPEINEYCQHNNLSPQDFFTKTLAHVFQEFPQIDGIILRIGENDGKDVSKGFLSSLLLKTPEQANTLLKNVLPLFEQKNKSLIFRTWTVGVHPIGDLIWNPKTFDTVFKSIDSESLIISMKYGDTDFMRNLALNPLFFHSNHKKIIELQTRREWEGMGTYPSFVGWDYQNYYSQLTRAKGMIGIQVWCQTGGWATSAWKNITYGSGSSFWNELNTEITFYLFYDGCTLTDAIDRFCTSRNIENPGLFGELLELSDSAIKKGLYIPEVSRQTLYFRRSRIPTLMWLTWDKTLLNPLTIRIIQALVRQPEQAIKDGEDAVRAIRHMRGIAQKLALPVNATRSIDFQLRTFELFAKIRHVVFDKVSVATINQLNNDIKSYHRSFHEHYTISPLPIKHSRALPRWILAFVIRRSPRYRLWDHILLFTSPLQRKLVKYMLKRSNSPLADQSMGIDVLFM